MEGGNGANGVSVITLLLSVTSFVSLTSLPPFKILCANCALLSAILNNLDREIKEELNA